MVVGGAAVNQYTHNNSEIPSVTKTELLRLSQVSSQPAAAQHQCLEKHCARVVGSRSAEKLLSHNRDDEDGADGDLIHLQLPISWNGSTNDSGF